MWRWVRAGCSSAGPGIIDESRLMTSLARVSKLEPLIDSLARWCLDPRASI